MQITILCLLQTSSLNSKLYTFFSVLFALHCTIVPICWTSYSWQKRKKSLQILKYYSLTRQRRQVIESPNELYTDHLYIIMITYSGVDFTWFHSVQFITTCNIKAFKDQSIHRGIHYSRYRPSSLTYFASEAFITHMPTQM